MLNQILQKPPHTHIDTYIDAKQVVPFVIYLAKLCQSQAMHEILHTNYGRKCRKRRHRLANQVGQTIQYIHMYIYVYTGHKYLPVCVCVSVWVRGLVWVHFKVHLAWRWHAMHHALSTHERTVRILLGAPIQGDSSRLTHAGQRNGATFSV